MTKSLVSNFSKPTFSHNNNNNTTQTKENGERLYVTSQYHKEQLFLHATK